MLARPKPEAFCQAYVAAGNASEAYRRAYQAAGMKPSTIHRRAKELMDDSKITARIAELREAMAKTVTWTRNDSARALIAIVHGDDANPAAKIAAVKELNAMYGFNAPEKVALDSQGYTLTVVRALEPIRDDAWL